MPNRSALCSAIALTASLVAFAIMPANANAVVPFSGYSADQFTAEASPIQAAALRADGCKITCKIGSFCLPLC
jgi:hypothetical protein